MAKRSWAHYAAEAGIQANGEAELAGLDYGDGFAQVAQPRAPRFAITTALLRKIEKHGTLHIHDVYHRTVRRDGKVIADWWPHKNKWRIAGVNATGNADDFVAALAKATEEKPQP